ncbi:hypothetical protein [Paenibacillus sp. NPDC058177]|uniref:hypothetical protein n=1 Tax=Paenibacillus sp. NPDC058177 TaxID=3346369 RepID=UPI0036DEC62F
MTPSYRVIQQYGWHEIEYFYHYYNPAVQRFRWVEYVQKTNYQNKQKVKELQPQIEEAITNIILNEEITNKEIAASLDIVFTKFRQHGLLKKTNDIKRKFKNDTTQIELLEKVNQFVVFTEEKNLPVKCKDVYEYLGKSSNAIKTVMPSLAVYITEQSELSKRKYQEYKMKELMIAVDEYILDEYNNIGKIPSIRKISKEFKVNGKLHTKYRLVLEHIQQTIYSLKQKHKF